MSCVWLLLACTYFTLVPTYCGENARGVVLLMCIPPTLSPPPFHFCFPDETKMHKPPIEIVWAYLNKTSHKLDGNESSSNAGLIKMDVFFNRSYCDTMLDPDPQLSWGGGWGCRGALSFWSRWGDGQEEEEEYYTATASVTGENCITVTSTVTAFI